MEPDHDDLLRDIFEWYSREFHTPLHTVQTLPLDEVMVSYYRHVYRQLEPEDRHNHAIWLLETPEERAARALNDKKSDEDFARQAAEANEGKKKKKKPSAAEQAFKRMQDKLLENLGDGLIKSTIKSHRPLPVKEMPETELVSKRLPEPEEVTITYMSPEEMDREIEQADAAMAPKPRKR